MKTLSFGLCLMALLVGPAFAEPFAKTIKGDLVALKGKHVVHFNDAALTDAKYFAIYFSASWCGPCKLFTPSLVTWYQQEKPKHPEFELIFVSRDTDENAMESYMRVDQMPWPALKYSKIQAAKNIEALAGPGIPCLVFVDADGKVLSHSYDGEKYVGPKKVLADIGKTLGKGTATAPGGTSTPSPGSTTKKTQ